MRQGYAGVDASGQFTRIWDGDDDLSERVAAGIYYYRIHVSADAESASLGGVVSVAY